MLLTRSLPPQFLLPAWSTPKLYWALQRTYKSDNASDKRPRRPRRLRERKQEFWPQRTSLSIYEELFPEEEGEKYEVEDEKVDKLPPFQWNEAVVESRETQVAEYRRGQIVPYSRPESAHQFQILTKDVYKPSSPRELTPENPMRKASVLILNCASKILGESDFYRVSPRGEHIEGWTRSIIKVIQSRDSKTLEPLGTYFILFSSDVAARAYLDQTIRLHTLARANSGSLRTSTLPPPPGFLREGEDMKTALKSFTLVPGHSKLSISLANRPFSSSIVQMLQEGGSPGMVALQSRGEGMVILSVNTGRINKFDIHNAINADGKRRNLHWEIADDGISRIGTDEQDHDLEELLEDAEGGGEDEKAGPAKGRYRRASTKHVLSFKDRYEAQRFVREWHRRPFPGRKDISPGGEPPPLVNAEIMW